METGTGVAGLLLLGLAVCACSGNTEKGNQQPGGSGSGVTSGAGGKTASGSGATGGSGAQPVAGSSSSGGVGGAGGGTGGGEAADGGEPPFGSAGEGGGDSAPDPTQVVPSSGCGTAAAQALGEFVAHTIETSGTKEPDCTARFNGQPQCGPWSLTRDYHLWLPPGYDPAKPYPIVFQAPGCSGAGTAVYSLSPSNAESGVDVGVSGSVIRVGLTPPPASVGHATNPNQGCFDDKEGDDSVDFVFYEMLLDRLKGELCIDENRVFASGNNSGAWLANELGCKYSGDTEGHAIRGVAVNMGGLPTEPQYRPTCTTKPMAGIWVWAFDDGGQPFNPSQYAVSRALEVNGCSATSWETADYEDFPIGAGNTPTTCKNLVGCPADYPVVVCALPGDDNGTHAGVANPAFATFIDSLAAP